MPKSNSHNPIEVISPFVTNARNQENRQTHSQAVINTNVNKSSRALTSTIVPPFSSSQRYIFQTGMLPRPKAHLALTVNSHLFSGICPSSNLRRPQGHKDAKRFCSVLRRSARRTSSGFQGVWTQKCSQQSPLTAAYPAPGPPCSPSPPTG